MSLADAAASIEARNVAIATYETFGHLEPQPRTIYKCSIVFACTAYGGHIVIISADFENLDDSPGLYMDMQDFAGKKCKSGVIHCFDGTYVRFKNGGYRFSGKIREVKP